MAGTLTRTQIENEALDNVAKNSALTLTSGTTLATRMTTWVNRSQLWIARKADLLSATATANTIASQQTYALPSNLRCLFSIKFEDGLNSRKLTCVMPWEFDRKIPKPSSTTEGRSYIYVPYKDTSTFELFPIPEAAYTLRMRYSYFPADFTSASAVSEYTMLDDALVAYSTMFAFRWLQELKDAAVWEKHGNDILAEVVRMNDEATQFPDWAPSGEGFSINESVFTGDYYNNPFVHSSDINSYWR